MKKLLKFKTLVEIEVERLQKYEESGHELTEKKIY
jgi:hypothetical protein